MHTKCPVDDPRRCHGVTSNGQCPYLAVERAKFCDFHSKGKAKRKLETNQKHRYLIDNEELRKAYLRQHDDRDYLSLKDEIVLVQALLERRLNMASTEADQIMATTVAMQLVQRLESMKVALMKIQQQLGLVLGKDQVRELGGHIVTILDEELVGIDNKDIVMENIGQRIYEAIELAGTPNM